MFSFRCLNTHWNLCELLCFHDDIEYIYKGIFFFGTVGKYTNTHNGAHPWPLPLINHPFSSTSSLLHFIFSTSINWRLYLHFVMFQCVTVRWAFNQRQMPFLTVDHNIKPSEFLFTPPKPQDKMGFDEVREQNLWNALLDWTLLIVILQRNFSWFKLLWCDIFLFCPASFLRLSRSLFSPQIFLINLKRRLDRRERMLNTMAVLGVEATLIDAVDGK